MGYQKWSDGVQRSKSLRHLTLQQLKVKDWDFLPDHKLDCLKLNAVRGPATFPKAQLAARCEKLELVRMEKALGFDPAQLFSAPISHSHSRKCYSICVQADGLSFASGMTKNGHGWAREFARLCPLPKGVNLDPEADMVSICGPKSGLSKYKTTLVQALARTYG